MADISTCLPLTRSSVQAAHEIVKPHVHYTPVLTNKTLDEIASTPQPGIPNSAKPILRLYFKCENLQRIGAFKVRGAFHAIERLKAEPGWVEGGGMQRGVVTHSSGNHAQALALAARESGILAHIVMPEISAAPKVAATNGYGARVYFSGSTSEEREVVTKKVIEETGARLVPPYDHPDIMLGQGTMGLEMQEQVERMIAERRRSGTRVAGGKCSAAIKSADEPCERNNGVNGHTKKGLDAIITPCGGGGMLSGVALSCEGTGIRVFGSEPSFQGADDACQGFKTGIRVEKVKSLTIGDGLRTPVGKIPWSVIYDRRLVTHMYSVTEDEIKAALRLVYERMKLVIEPSSAVPLAVALYNEDFRHIVEREAGLEGWDLGIIFSGGNVSLECLGKLFA